MTDENVIDKSIAQMVATVKKRSPCLGSMGRIVSVDGKFYYVTVELEELNPNEIYSQTVLYANDIKE